MTLILHAEGICMALWRHKITQSFVIGPLFDLGQEHEVDRWVIEVDRWRIEVNMRVTEMDRRG